MKRRPAAVAASQAMLCAVFATAVSAQELHHQARDPASPILALYDFEETIPSGPDTFWIHQAPGSEIALSRAFRLSGERSLHITEVPGNREFAEFLAYFQERREGAVFVQFYILFTDPTQRFNFGLAGPAWFLSREQGGHAVWLQTRDGAFQHHPRDGWETLFEPRSFVWHFIDLVVQLDRGLYDLAVYEEGIERPLVDIHGARAFHGRRDSPLKFFSLIGDLEDQDRFDFFVDDLLIASHPEVRRRPFVAPGRRSYFVDLLPAPGAAPAGRTEDLEHEAWGWLSDLDAADAAAADRLEAAADRAFRESNLGLAGAIYERLSELPGRGVRALLKLADVRHLQGERDAERSLRESIYGRLELEEFHGLDGADYPPIREHPAQLGPAD